MTTYAFSGSRHFTDRRLVERVMRHLLTKPGLHRVRVGDAVGLDDLVAHEATRWGIWPEVQVCHWPPPGATRQERWMAAHERNGRVLDGADLLVALYGDGPPSPGTTDCITQARQRGIPVHVWQGGRWS